MRFIRKIKGLTPETTWNNIDSEIREKFLDKFGYCNEQVYAFRNWKKLKNEIKVSFSKC